VSSMDSIWRRGLPLEVEFWEEYIRTRGGAFPDDYRERLDPASAITDELVLDAVARSSSNPIRILDVGAGPLTAIGKRDARDPERKIEVVAIDPLAREYQRILDKFGLTAPVRTMPCRGEDVAAQFGPDTFDIAYARNAVDHAADAMRIIEGMVEVVRPGGTVVLRHYRREAEEMGYEQLHQWNCDVDEGRLVLWGKRDRYDVTQRLQDRAKVTARTHPGSYHADWVEAAIKPLGRRARGSRDPRPTEDQPASPQE
jgi:SAM-dependent methyltransferase